MEEEREEGEGWWRVRNKSGIEEVKEHGKSNKDNIKEGDRKRQDGV